MTWKVGFDTNGDGIACLNYTAGDEWNDLYHLLPGHTDYLNILTTGSTGASVTPHPTITPHGCNFFRISLSTAGVETAYIFTDSVDYQLEALTGFYYTFVFWYRYRSGSGAVVTPYMNINSTTVAAPALAANTSWTRVAFTVTLATADRDLFLTFEKDTFAATMIYDVTGLMCIKNGSTFTAPQGYNSGDTALDAYDLISSRVVEPLEWEGGVNSYDTVSGEKRARCILSNTDERFSPDNTNSPLYGNLLPNRNFMIYYNNQAMYTGFIDLITPDFGKAGTQRTLLTATNLVRVLKAHKEIIPKYESRTADYIIYDVLKRYDQRLADYAQYSDKLDAGVVTFNYYGDNSQQSELAPQRPLSLWTVFEELTEAEGGKLYVDVQGAVRFRERRWDKTTASSSADLTLDNTATDLRYVPVSAKIITRLTVKCYPRSIGAGATTLLWQLDSPMTIDKGKKFRFKAKYRNGGLPTGAKDVATPAGADYTITGGSPVLTFEAGGEEADVIIDNTAGSTNATLSVFNIKGRTITSTYPVELVHDSEYLIERYGYRDAGLDLKALDTLSSARRLAEWLFALLSLEQGEIISVTVMKGDDGVENVDLLALTFGDVIAISDDQLGIDGLFYNIVGWKHSVHPRYKTHTVTYQLEVSIKQTFWRLGISRLGVNTRLGR